MFFTYWEDLGSTPARVNRFTGEIQINQRYFDRMPDFSKRFIIEHEKGHFLNDTRSEFEADQYAFNKVAGTAPRSLKNSVYAISQVLTFRNPEHTDRLAELVKTALEYDYARNGNQKAKEGLVILNELITNHKNNLYMNTLTSDRSYFNPQYPMSGFDDLYDNARGAGRARRQAKKQERKTTRIANKAQRQQGRIEKRTNRTNARVANRQTRITARVANRAAKQDNSYMQNQPMPQPQEIYNDQSGGYQDMPAPNISYPQDIVYNDPIQYGEPIETVDDQYFEEEPEEEMESYFGEDGTCLDESYYDNGGGKARREAKRAAKQQKRELKNKRLEAKNEIKLSRADKNRAKGEAKKSLADQGKSGNEWLGGAIDGVLGLFGKGKKGDAEVSTGPSGVAGDISGSGGDGKILGMPKGVAVAVIILVVLAIIAAVITILMKKKRVA